MLVMDVIAEILKREGINTMFCYPTTPIIEAAAAAGIRPILCRQERVGVDMANGYARTLNGKPPAVFAMQYGPGVENAFSGIATAYSDSTPVLLLPLAHEQHISQMFPLFRSTAVCHNVTKSVEQMLRLNDIADIMRRAFNELKNGRPGPAMVELPREMVQKESGIETLNYQPVRRAISAGNPHDIEDAAKMLVEARCPMILGGQGIMYSEATDAVVELAQLLGLPVLTTVEGKSAFPEDHELSLGAAGAAITGHGRYYLNESDLIIGIGASFTPHFLCSPKIPAGKKLIQITNDTRDFHKANNIDVPILGDANLVVRQLIDAVRDRLSRNRAGRESPVGKIRELAGAWRAGWEDKLNSTQTPMTPYRVINEFMRVINPAEAIVTHDSGSPRDQILPFYKATKPRTYMGWGKSHALGTGLGLTIGAKIAQPKQFCVNFMGDAAFGMVGLDFETAVRTNTPILTVVLNNSTMAIETDSMKVSDRLYNTRAIGGQYANLAKDLGGWSEKVEDPGAVGEAFLRAKRQTENGQACLLEFITNSETEFSFRHNAVRQPGEKVSVSGR
jgi:acetolactate synthase-1/2/3 large subunit